MIMTESKFYWGWLWFILFYYIITGLFSDSLKSIDKLIICFSIIDVLLAISTIYVVYRWIKFLNKK